MPSEFHLSIKNNQRKIVDVRQLFQNLSESEWQILELAKLKSEEDKRKKNQLEKTNLVQYRKLKLERCASQSDVNSIQRVVSNKRPPRPKTIYDRMETTQTAEVRQTKVIRMHSRTPPVKVVMQTEETRNRHFNGIKMRVKNLAKFRFDKQLEPMPLLTTTDRLNAFFNRTKHFRF